MFWHPKGWRIFQQLIGYMRERQDAAGYQEVNAPEIMDRELWEQSGHLEKFGENMFLTQTPDERVFAIKPMNCPGHVQIFNQGMRSYRDLPLRFAEFGKVHRYEPSGALHGLMRVRAFTQDDAHIFITEDQITEESVAVIELLLASTGTSASTTCAVKFSDRPPKRVGSRRDLGPGRKRRCKAAAAAAGIECELQPGRGRLLRPEARIRPAGRHRPRLAVRHPAGGPEPAGPARAPLHRRAQPAADARHAAPGDFRLAGAFFRHPARAPRRPTARLAGPGAGRGDEHHRPAGRLRADRLRKP